MSLSPPSPSSPGYAQEEAKQAKQDCLPFLSSTEREKRNSVTHRNLGPFEGPRGEGGKWRRPRQHKDFALFRCGKGAVVSRPKIFFQVSRKHKNLVWENSRFPFFEAALFTPNPHLLPACGKQWVRGRLLLFSEGGFFSHTMGVQLGQGERPSLLFWAGLERGCKKTGDTFFGRAVGLPIPM